MISKAVKSLAIHSAVIFTALFGFNEVSAQTQTQPQAQQPAAATGSALYRCQQGKAITIQDSPCPKGASERKIEFSRIEPSAAPAPAPAYPPPAPVAAPPATAAPTAVPPPPPPPPAAAPAPDPTPAQTQPVNNNEAANVPPQNIAANEPPPIWRCSDALNGDERLIEQFDTNRRCVPLGVLGYDLSGMPTEAAGVCRWIEDQCARQQGASACSAWNQYLDKAQSDLRYAFSDTQDAKRAQFQRIEGIVKQHCRN